MGQLRRAAAAIAFLLALAAVFTDAPARWLVARDPPQRADAVVVLAGDPDYERTKTGARLVLDGQARLLVLTGGEPGPGDSAQSLRDVALRAGVPPARIRLERVSHSTHESLEAVRTILEREGVRRVIVVTSPYHQRRAAWAARRSLRGIAILSQPAEPAAWKPEGWWQTARGRRLVIGEYAKLVYYVLRGWA